MAGPTFDFTREEIVAKAGGQDPWATQEQFNGEVNIEDMARAGEALNEAAESARDVKELAASADEISETSGAQNEAPLVLSRDRFNETNVQIKDPQLDRAVEYNFRAMGQAYDTLLLVNAAVKHDGLEPRIDGYKGEALGDWNWWETLRQNLDQQYRDNPTATMPTIGYKERQVTFGRLPDGTVTLPSDLPAQIRETYLTKAGDDARQTGEHIDGLITRYRRELTGMADELRESGYDLTTGPVDIFTSPQMAEFTAEEINQMLTGDQFLDEQRLEKLTRTLEEITGGVYGDPHAPDGNPKRDLTAEEQNYLESFYNKLTSDSLARLGDVGEDFSGFSTSNIANGINMLMNESIYPPGEKPPPPPASISEFIYDYQNGDISRPQNQEQFANALRRFNDFGDVMSSATVGSGNEFSKDLAHAAIDIEEYSAQQPAYNQWAPDGSLVENTASSDMLQTASLNTLASAQLLNDDGFRNDLLSQGWDDSTGAGALIESGTTIPQDIGNPHDDVAYYNEPGARIYTEAASKVLTDAPSKEAHILGMGSTGREGPAGVDNAALQRAIGKTALQNMEFIGTPSTPGDKSGMTDVEYVAGREHNFILNRDTRQGLFELMHGTQEDVRTEFFEGVGAWQYQETAESASGGKFNTEAISRVGTIQGTIEEVDTRLAMEPWEQRSMAATVANGVGTAAAAAFPVAGSLAAGGAALLIPPLSGQAESIQDDAIAQHPMARFTIGSAAVNEIPSIANEVRAGSDQSVGEAFGEALRDGSPSALIHATNVASQSTAVKHAITEYERAYIEETGGEPG
jgi:hypothetical protein